MTILLTGGAGYIDSHIACYLSQQGHNVIILDSFVNSKIKMYDSLSVISKLSPKLFIGDKNVEIINVGSGKGYSVMKIINTFSKLNTNFEYNIVNRREGDIPKIYSDISKAEKVLNWKPKRTLEDSIKSLLKI